MALLLKNLLFTVVVPGTAAVYLPYLILLRDPAPAAWPAGTRLLGVVVGVAGVLVYLRCAWDFAVRGRGTPAPVDPPRVLVVQGLYRYVRNPMYIGVFLVLLGEVLFFRSSRLALYLACWSLLVHLFVLTYEEPALDRAFGESYRQYRRQVRRWLPGKPYHGV